MIADRIQEVLASGQRTLESTGELSGRSPCGVRHAVAVTAARARSILFRPASGKSLFPPTPSSHGRGGGARRGTCDMDPGTLALGQTVKPLLWAWRADRDRHIGGVVSPCGLAACLEQGFGWWRTRRAHGSAWAPPAGGFGIGATFSFYHQGHDIGGGGMIVTNDDRPAEESRIYRDQGKRLCGKRPRAHGIQLAPIGTTPSSGSHLERSSAMIAAGRRSPPIPGAPHLQNSNCCGPPTGVCNYYKYSRSSGADNRQELKVLRECHGVSWRERSMRPCTCSPFSQNSPAARCRSRRTSAPVTSAFRSSRGWRMRTQTG